MRYFSHTEEDVAAMLQSLGADSLEDLFAVIPPDCRIDRPLRLPDPLTEWELEAHLQRLSKTMAADTGRHRSFLGAGSYDHFIPAVVPYLLGRSEFSTAYTPYQPEISQGTLQAIYEYQTLTARLLGMEVANASLYDGATALAEALLMAVRITRRRTVAISRLVHPLYRRVVRTYFHPTCFDVVELPAGEDGRTDFSALQSLEEPAAIAVQSPNFFGIIEELTEAAAGARKTGALLTVSFTEALAYGLLRSPGSLGADIVCGEGQSLGISPSFGGPGLGMFASKMQFVRNMPGRLVGVTQDIDGRRGFVLTLATREQHIRREKATSNICTNNSLCALTAAIYMASLGRSGMGRLAVLNHDKAEYLKQALGRAGVAIPFSAPTFNEFVVKLPAAFADVHRRLLQQGVVAGLDISPYFPELPHHYLLCATETKTKADLDNLVLEIASCLKP